MNNIGHCTLNRVHPIRRCKYNVQDRQPQRPDPRLIGDVVTPGGMPKYIGRASDNSATSKSIRPANSIGGANFSRPSVRSASFGRAVGGNSSAEFKSLTTAPSTLSNALLSPAILRENVR